ncbi:Retrovirus-related Pol polyprotein from transposon 17.6 [Merluccius polli]|uniref:Retrovirus-related Pol polyprotein from transposon 17.6 n=1 Tax=Merluccius polli TaxID=89951 RepID=A0AA47MUF8_MERPO|nr:Retrovirus-related Pol polyprotein from transposon 17.6 [Merluccius polli]
MVPVPGKQGRARICVGLNRLNQAVEHVLAAGRGQWLLANTSGQGNCETHHLKNTIWKIFLPQTSFWTPYSSRDLSVNAVLAWGPALEKAFAMLKTMISNAPVLAFYDVNRLSTMSADVSSYGLGGVVLQDQDRVAYCSRTLTSTQTRYAQIEKECLDSVCSGANSS